VLRVVTRLTIVRNPASDRAFEHAVTELIDSGLRDPATVQERLRERYPRAIVRARGLSGEGDPTWYVYRDGRWISGD